MIIHGGLSAFLSTRRRPLDQDRMACAATALRSNDGDVKGWHTS